MGIEIAGKTKRNKGSMTHVQLLNTIKNNRNKLIKECQRSNRKIMKHVKTERALAFCHTSWWYQIEIHVWQLQVFGFICGLIFGTVFPACFCCFLIVLSNWTCVIEPLSRLVFPAISIPVCTISVQNCFPTSLYRFFYDHFWLPDMIMIIGRGVSKDFRKSYTILHVYIH